MESARRSEALCEEMELHLAEKAAELQADGMTPEHARAEARRRFGNVGQKQEESREIWMIRFWSEFGQDVRYGCRTMAANKAFSALAVLSLALGIGANTESLAFISPPATPSPAVLPRPSYHPGLSKESRTGCHQRKRRTRQPSEWRRGLRHR